MSNKAKNDYALWNEYLNTPKEVFMMKHGASFSTKDLEMRERETPYTSIDKYVEPEGKLGKCIKLETPYGYETNLN